MILSIQYENKREREREREREKERVIHVFISFLHFKTTNIKKQTHKHKNINKKTGSTSIKFE